jgi:gamma-glutamyltranspeptidase / glutathione hydrolase
MDDFSSPGQTNSFGFSAAPVNFIEPGKRPQSSISSSIAEDLETGEFVIATGSAGGSRIITATLKNLYHYLDQGMTPNETVHQVSNLFIVLRSISQWLTCAVNSPAGTISLPT